MPTLHGVVNRSYDEFMSVYSASDASITSQLLDDGADDVLSDLGPARVSTG